MSSHLREMWRAASALSLAEVISVAEEVMDRSGQVGATIEVPQGHADDPAYRAAIEPLEDYCSKVMGQSMYRRVYTSEYTLRQEGYPLAMVTSLGAIVLRPVTNEVTILHECAHLLNNSQEGEGHDRQFAETARDLYARYIGPDAAETFWNVVEPFVDGTVKTAATDQALISRLEFVATGDSADQVRTLTALLDGKAVGQIQVFGRYYTAKARGRVKWISVADGHERQGIATALWHRAAEVWTDLTLKHSEDRTDDGDAWARSVGGQMPRRLSRTAATEHSSYRGVELGYGFDGATDRQVIDRLRFDRRGGWLGTYWTADKRMATEFAVGVASTNYRWFAGTYPDENYYGVLIEAVHAHEPRVEPFDWDGFVLPGETTVQNPIPDTTDRLRFHLYRLPAGAQSPGLEDAEFVRTIDIPKSLWSKASRTAALSGIKVQSPTPLDYRGKFWGPSKRFYITDSGAGEVSKYDYYFKDNPRQGFTAPEDPETVAWLDIFEQPAPGRPWVYIAFVAVRDAYRGQGLGSRLIKHLYETYPDARIEWGTLIGDRTPKMYQKYKQTHPEQTGGGSPW